MTKAKPAVLQGHYVATVTQNSIACSGVNRKKVNFVKSGGLLILNLPERQVKGTTLRRLLIDGHLTRM